MPDTEGETAIPLFPLGNVVLFPSCNVPLYVFEPRYRQMIGDEEKRAGRVGMVARSAGVGKNRTT